MKIVKQKANLIPYRLTDGRLEFYLSHRSKTAKQFPDMWSFWGGGVEEGESPERAMLCEIKEELNWEPTDFKFLGKFYDSMPNEKFIFFTEVDINFEKQIEIRESQGGKFFNIDQIKDEEKIIEEDKKVIYDLKLFIEKAIIQ